MPRKIIGGAFISLDGVIQAPGGPTEDPTGGFPYGGWLSPLFDEAFGDQIDTLFNRDFDLLLGRRTYEIFAGYWPFAPADMPITQKFAKADKYVLSAAGIDLPWATSHHLADIDALAALKAQDGRDMVIQGSSTLYPQLLAHGLLDRLILMTAPVILGTGKRLFGDGTPARTMTLLEQRTTRGGSILSTYEPAGPVETAAIAEQEPSALEQERRKRMDEGSW